MIFQPFLVPIAWALCLAAVTARPYRALARAWLNRELGEEEKVKRHDS